MYQLEQTYTSTFFRHSGDSGGFSIAFGLEKNGSEKVVDKELLKKLSPNRSLFKSVLKVLVLCLAIRLSFALVNQKLEPSWKR